MAGRSTKPRYSDIPGLKGYILKDVQKTGKKLGFGAFGMVEELTYGGTICAGKKLHAELLDVRNEGIQRTIDRFISECKLMSKIRHPRIVLFMGLCFFDDSPYPMLVMEKVDVNLETILETRKNIPLPLTLRILQDVAEGLIHMHGQNPPIIHRDLTARNVLVNRASMRAKIADLGNALCMVDRNKLTNHLSQAPGTFPYMPPEALLNEPSYDSMLDMFSFGHLALFAVIQEFPKDILPPTYYDESLNELKARSEVERRDKYIKKLYAKLTNAHVVTKMILQCLHNMPQKRLTANKVMEKLSSVCTDEDGVAYGQVDLVELINRADKAESKAVHGQAAAKHDDPMKRRVNDYKNGAPGVLDVFRMSGNVMSRRVTWRSQVFQIKDGCLNYFRQDMLDRPHDSLSLSLVAGVKPCPPKVTWNQSMFYFEVHFSGGKGSPWLLRAYTQDDRTCWMEAISSGSSAIFRPPTADAQYEPVTPVQYEPVTPVPEGEAYSYVPVHHQQNAPQGRKDLKELYNTKQDVGRSESKLKVPPIAQRPLPAPPSSSQLDDENPLKTIRRARTPSPSRSPMRMAGTVASKEAHDGRDTSAPASQAPVDEPYYDDIDVVPPSDTYVIMTSKAAEESQHGAISTLMPEVPTAEEKDFPNLLSQSEAQLMVLNQIQRQVQEFKRGNEVQRKMIFPQAMETFPAGRAGERHVHFCVGDSIVESYPPFQPRTYSQTAPKTREQEEMLAPGRRGAVRRREPRTVYGVSNVSSSTTSTKYSPTQKSPFHQPHRLPNKETVELSAVGRRNNYEQGESGPEMVTTREEMLSTLKATSKSISSDIASHLVVDDKSSTLVTGKRQIPDWAKAKTLSPKLEPSLADLEQKAQFLPRSALGHTFEEIGEGQFGKIYKGTLKRSGLTVAVKTIKRHESEREKIEFDKEMTIMSQLIHPNIVRLFGLVQQDPPLIVLEYLPHGDLKRFLTINKRTVRKLIKYMLDVATGMHYLSEKGLVHRDLAARNVMVSKSEICKVGDFGLLRKVPKNVGVYEATTKVPCPTRWMAPECHLRNEFSPATDVWSFGVVMWEMYNPKETPYKGMRNTEVAANVCIGTTLPIPHEYPETVKSIMNACWRQNPSERPSFLLIASLLTNAVFGTD